VSCSVPWTWLPFPRRKPAGAFCSPWPSCAPDRQHDYRHNPQRSVGASPTATTTNHDRAHFRRTHRWREQDSNHRSPVRESRRFEPASVPSRGGRCRRGGYGPGEDRRPDRAVEIADRRWCASEPPLESRIKPSRRVGPSRGTDGSNPSPSSGESRANLSSSISCRRRCAVGVAVADID
jgi:hypothetical protein